MPFFISLAILHLAEALKLEGPNKGTLCLPDNLHPVHAGSICDLAGWGDLSWNGTTPETLQHVQLPIVSLKKCNEWNAYNGIVNDLNLCAGLPEGGKDACQGDSGAALAYKYNGRHYARGVVSTGFECARPNKYGLYTDVPKMKAWIVETLVSINGKQYSKIHVYKIFIFVGTSTF